MKIAARQVWHPFLQHTNQPGETQLALLQKILKQQAETTFGRTHEFARLRTYDEYRRALPIQGYEDLRPYIEEQDRRREPIVTIDQPSQFVQTSGTTGQPKYIPVCSTTKAGIAEYQRLFAYAQCQGVPDIFEGRVLVLSGQSVEGRLPTGTPYGSMSGLLFEGLPWPIRRKDALPARVRMMTDVSKKYRCIAASALAEPDISVIATPNPSTLLTLIELIQHRYAELVEALASCGKRGAAVNEIVQNVDSHRMRYLKSCGDRGVEVTFATLWPRLRAVITWMGGNCGVVIPRLKSLLPKRTKLIEMGYLSSEFLGSLNVDVLKNSCVPTLHENVFEFVPLGEWETAEPRTLAIDEVEVGEKYQVVVTTQSGLYRYAMNDIVEVTGRFNRTPLIRFVQKGKGVTNITGEKLYEHHVVSAVDKVLVRLGLSCEFYIMLADVEAQQYRCYLESVEVPDVMAEELDRTLAELNVEFKSKRESGRLKPLVVEHLRPGTANEYRDHCLRRGQREAQFKLVRLQYRHECAFDLSTYTGT